MDLLRAQICGAKGVEDEGAGVGSLILGGVELHQAYLRQADGDYPMSTAEEQLLLAIRDRPRHDAKPVVGATVADLDSQLVAEFVSAVRMGSRRLRVVDEETLLRRRGILEPAGDSVTLAGLYALGEYPQQFAPNLEALFTTFFSAGRAGPCAPARRPCRDPWHTVQELELSGNPTRSRHGPSAGSGPGSTNGEEGESATEISSRPGPVNNAFAVTAAVVAAAGEHRNRLEDLAHFDGPRPDLLEASLEWVRRNLRVGVRVEEDGNHYGRPELPLSAVRELVANALVHRDLGPHTQTKRVEIQLLPDRLVVTSPGGLWGVSREQLGTAAGKSAVNEYLYSACAYVSTARGARVIEGEGGGIVEVQKALSEWHADPPLFIDRAVSFTAVLVRPSLSRASSGALRRTPEDPQSRILALLESGPLDRASIGDLTGLAKSQTRYALERLISRERVRMQGGSVHATRLIRSTEGWPTTTISSRDGYHHGTAAHAWRIAHECALNGGSPRMCRGCCGIAAVSMLARLEPQHRVPEVSTRTTR